MLGGGGAAIPGGGLGIHGHGVCGGLVLLRL
jgi:hypothetical protein